MPHYFEIRWHGRGGQGTVTGAKTLAEAVQGTGKFVTAFPEYGPERRGAPVKAFNRFADDTVRIHTPVKEPDLINHRPGLVFSPRLFSRLPPAIRRWLSCGKRPSFGRRVRRGSS